MGGEIELMRKKYCTMRGRGQVGKEGPGQRLIE